MAEDRFLSRWSRRKTQTRGRKVEATTRAAAPVTVPPLLEEPGETSDELPVSPIETQSDVGGSDGSDMEPDRVLSEDELDAKAEELGLPALETLGPGSDFTGFMGSDVPAQLRSLALRRLWRSNPVLANVDGLVDYGEDFTDAATVVKNMQTAYQVGRGYRRDPDPEDVPEDVPEEQEGEGQENEGLEKEDEILSDSHETEAEDLTAEDPESGAEPEIAVDGIQDGPSETEVLEVSEGVDTAAHSRIIPS